ncbi:hypothetical protein ABIA32_005021 [Streptacidiphilus sp. MAP12-20]|uniref:DUF4307 domain-containing protein n=1 Tax=Streptacidiphilus sp. MAP12-20 TaxID=3156299 RepID=UPI003514B121
MADTSQGVRPAGRYGGRDEEQARRRGKRIYYVTVGLVLALVAAIAWKYTSGSSVNGEVQTFQVVSDHSIKITLTVSKSTGQAASCTVRSRDANGNEVGRVTVTLPEGSGDGTTTVMLKTTSRGTTGELVGCS